MKIGGTAELAHALDRARQLSDAFLSSTHVVELWHAIKAKATWFLPLFFILAFAAGILLGTASEGLSDIVGTAANTFIEGYSFGAPVLIFLVLAPVLSRIFSTRRRGKFGLYAIGWLATLKVIALIFAVLFTVAVLGLPLLPESSVSLVGALVQTSRSLLATLVKSHFFWAIYVAVAVGLIAIRVNPLARLLERGITAIEYAGQYMQPLIPIFMFAVGVYIQSIPGQLEELGLEGATARLEPLKVLGFHLDPSTPSGVVTVYIVGSLLVAAACFLWHFGVLALAKYQCKLFSVRDYFTKYWVKAYPLLWSTSSESLATPLNLYILSTHAPWVRPTVRRVVIGAGSVFATNGTLICAIILLGIVGSMVGLRFSLVELLLAVPVALLISFGIPGIPGELLLFAGPLSMVLGVPAEVMPLFLTLYLGLQIGLPDSFRTGANATNNYVYCILLNEVYLKRFWREEPQETQVEV
jgi:Na+/H+-dicarboxylate symporter